MFPKEMLSVCSIEQYQNYPFRWWLQRILSIRSGIAYTCPIIRANDKCSSKLSERKHENEFLSDRPFLRSTLTLSSISVMQPVIYVVCGSAWCPLNKQRVPALQGLNWSKHSHLACLRSFLLRRSLVHTDFKSLLQTRILATADKIDREINATIHIGDRNDSVNTDGADDRSVISIPSLAVPNEECLIDIRKEQLKVKNNIASAGSSRIVTIPLRLRWFCILMKE